MAGEVGKMVTARLIGYQKVKTVGTAQPYLLGGSRVERREARE